MEASKISPFQRLIDIASVVQHVSHATTLKKKVKSYWTGLSALSGNIVFTTRLEDITQIMPVPPLAPVPNVKPWLKGIAMLRGELFPVTDLAGFIFDKPTVISKHARILVLKYESGYCGLLVDNILGLQQISEEQIKQNNDNTSLVGFNDFTVGVFENERIAIPIVDLKQVIYSPSFHDATLKKDFSMHKGLL